MDMENRGNFVLLWDLWRDSRQMKTPQPGTTGAPADLADTRY